MNKFIKISGKEIEYTLKINKRSKSLRISIHPGGRVLVSVPCFVPEFFVNKFIFNKSDWIIEKMEELSKIKPIKLKSKKEQREDYLKYKDDALRIAEERLRYFNKFYNLKWGKITIRNQKTRWGSCSKKGNLNFNYKIALLDKEQSDYIIVHELCHLREFNHSQKFWDLVSIAVPRYKEIRKNLKFNNLKLD